MLQTCHFRLSSNMHFFHIFQMLSTHYTFIKINRKQKMSKLLTCIRYAASKIYPANIDLSTASTFYAKDLTISKTLHPKQLPKFDAKTLVFGKHSSDHMAVVDWEMNEGWSKPSIVPMAPLQIHPFNSSLHYAVQCFEGMKAYKDPQGKIRLFRPECNALRLKRSSQRISLPDFDGEEFIKLLAEYVKVEQRWIPSLSEFSLYLRPLHISMENSLGVKSPGKSKLLILGCPVGPYYPTGFQPISLSCGVGTIRSAPGGTGMFKVGGNYGPTLGTTKDANMKGHQQVLWLYGDKKIIEVGASNIFFVFKSKNGKKAEIVTPDLEDLILPGITRDSIINYLQAHPEYEVVERQIMIDEVIERNRSGELLECFSAGTAVVIGSVKNIEYKGENHSIYIDEKLKAGPITAEIRDDIVGIQEGRKKDNLGWTRIIN